MNKSKSMVDKALEQRFISSTKLFREKAYLQSQELLQKLINDLTDKLNKIQPLPQGSSLKRLLSECYLNNALCLLSQEEQSQSQIMECLQKAVQFDNLNYWAYFNLFSLYQQAFSYQRALQNIKCCLSCLYLIKAVLSKDPESKSRQKDLSKAIGFCPNNLEAEFIRLLLHIKQFRWRNAINQIAIIEQLIGQNKHLQSLNQLLSNRSHPQSNEKSIIQTAIRTVLVLQGQSSQKRLIASPEEEPPESIIKLISDKLYEFNEVLAQINELGHVFGVFNYKSVSVQEYANKKIIVMSNLIVGGYSRDNQVLDVVKSKVVQQFQRKEKQSQLKVPEVANQSNYNQSLFDYTKSNNQYIESSKREAEISGNLLSSINATKRSPPAAKNQESPQLNMSTFNLQSVILANMRKKEVQIRSIESEIQPLDPEDNIYQNLAPHTHYFSHEDDDLLLDSAFDKSFAGKSNLALTKKDSTIKKKDLLEESNRSRSKMQKSKTEKITLEQKKQRIYPLDQKYRYLQLELQQFEFKEASVDRVQDMYCQFEVKSHSSKNQKFSSKRQSTKQVGFKQKVNWAQSLGYIQIPEHPQSLEIKLMKSQRDKFFDTCLGKGEIEMTSAGLNKFPIYNETKLIGIATVRLILSEECLMSSYKQSSLSSSHKTESQNSIS